MVSPTLTSTRVTSPCSMFSPNSGTLNSCISCRRVRRRLALLHRRHPAYVRGAGSASRAGAIAARPRRSTRRSGHRGVRLLRVDVEVFDRLLDHRDIQLPVAHERVERGGDDELAVHLEEVAKRRAVLAAAEAV